MKRFSDKYEVISEIGQGGMGTVYKVRHTALETILAIKVLPAQMTQDAEHVKRFYREARVMARLKHPNIAQVVDVQHDSELGVHYFIMEYIKGVTLREFVQQHGPLTSTHLLDVAKQVALALDYSHKFDPPVIHRDIKPSNIMIEDATNRVVVMDFGIAKELDDSDLTQVGTMLGTLKYCAPEQMRNEDVDGAADVYALGMVLYEVYTGAHLFKGVTEASLIWKIANEQEYEIPALPTHTPHGLETILIKAIKKDRNLRYRSMEELLKDINECWQTLDSTQPRQIADLLGNNTNFPEQISDLSQIDAQIQKLEEEKGRRLLGQTQEQVEQSMRGASAEGAEQFAAELYQQASAERDKAYAHQAAGEYPQARQAFEQAYQLFSQARAEAAKQSVQKSLDEIRSELTVAKHHADLCGAQERAEAEYLSAMQLKARAEDLTIRESYSEAYEIFKQARSSFEEAHDRAYELLLEKVLAIRNDAEAGQRELENLGIAPADYAAASELHRQAETMLKEGQMEDAAEHYKQAAWAYGEAIEASVRALLYQKMQSCREQVAALRAQVLADSHEAFAEELHKLEQNYAAAVQLADNQDVDAASKMFEGALQSWTKLLTDIQTKAQRDAAEQALAAMHNAKTSSAALRNWAAKDWEQADKQAAKAEQAWQQQDYAHVKALAENTVQAYADAASNAETQKQREAQAQEAERAAKVAAELAKAKHTADAAKHSAVAAREVAVDMAADKDLADEFAKAENLFKQAEQALHQADFNLAVADFGAAVHLYQQLAQQLELSQTQQLRDQALVLKQKIPADFTGAKLKQAEKTYTDGEKLLEKANYPEAAKSFQSAINRYSKLLENAEQAKSSAKQNIPMAKSGLYVAGAVLGIGAIAGMLFFTGQTDKPILKNESAGEPEPAKVTVAPAAIPVPTPAVAAAEPPVLSFSPAAQQLTLDEGQTLAFSVAAKTLKPQSLSYSWFLNDKKQAESAEWQYAPGFTDASDKPKELKVVVTEAGKALETRTWQVKVANVNRGPQLLSFAPEKENLELQVADVQEFSAKAKDPDENDQLKYSWLVDDKPVAASANWQFKAASPDLHTISVKISDAEGLEVHKVWQVQVNAAKVAAVPPMIVSVRPEIQAGKPVMLAVGEKQVFSAKAKSAEAGELHYSWYVDGKKTSDSSEWTYQPAANETAAKSKDVKLVVSDANGLTSEKNWKVILETANHPPEIEKTLPKAGETIKLTKDDSHEFSVLAKDPDHNDKLSFTWLYDGAKVGKDSAWVLQAKTEGNHKLELKVADNAGLSVERSWNVVVTAAEPVQLDIVDAKPVVNQLTAEAGEPLAFAVKANLSGKKSVSKDWHYEWRVDGAQPKQTANGEFSFKSETPGMHSLKVTAVGKEGLESSPHSWQIEIKQKKVEPPKVETVEAKPVEAKPVEAKPIEVKPAETKPVETKAVETKPVETAKPKESELKEAEVKAWLDRYQSAWQSKDVNALMGIGEVEARNAEKMKEIFQQYDDFHVSLQNVDINIDGNQATVSFERIDTINGKAMPQPGRKKLVLEKKADGHVSRH